MNVNLFLLVSVLLSFTNLRVQNSKPEVVFTNVYIINYENKLNENGDLIYDVNNGEKEQILRFREIKGPKELSRLRNIKFRYDTARFLGLKFNIKNCSNKPKEKLIFKYILKGFDDNWSKQINKNHVIYKKLKLGIYYFKIKASCDNGLTWSDEKSVRIIVYPKFFHSSLFWLFLIITVFAILFVIYRLRIKSIEKKKDALEKKVKEKVNEILKQKEEIYLLKEKENKQKLQEIELIALRSQLNPHFLFNSLSSIQNLINKNDIDNANIYLSRFAGLMRMILDNSVKTFIPISDELKTIETYLQLEALRFNFDFNITTDPKIDLYNTEIPNMIIQPYIENAINHGIAYIKGKGKINIDLTKFDDGIECIIEDNGIGINKSIELNKTNQRKISGNKLIEERIEKINEKYKLKMKLDITDKTKKSKTKTGTIVKIYINI